jgi:hypothetical protein
MKYLKIHTRATQAICQANDGHNRVQTAQINEISLGFEDDASFIAEKLITAAIFWASSSFGYDPRFNRTVVRQAHPQRAGSFTNVLRCAAADFRAVPQCGPMIDSIFCRTRLAKPGHFPLVETAMERSSR